MILYAGKAQRMILGVAEAEFSENEMLHLAVTRCIELVGEACKSVSPEARQRAPEIPWRSIARMRDLLIPHYFGVKLDAVYKVAKQDAPELIGQLRALLARIDAADDPAL